MTPSLLQAYKKFNQELWKKLELGQLSRQELLETRFQIFFDKYFDLKVNGLTVGQKYTAFLAREHQELPGAKELLTKLKQKKYRLHIVTNGNKIIQDQRIAEANFADFFDNIFISEEIGSQKPSLEFFEYVFTKGNINPDTALMLGDSLSSDIQGGINAKIDTLWFNPKKLNNSTGLKPTYEVSNLSEIIKIV